MLRSQTDLLDRIPEAELQAFVDCCARNNFEFPDRDDWLYQMGCDYIDRFGDPENRHWELGRRSQLGNSLAYQFTLTHHCERIAGRSNQQDAVELLKRYQMRSHRVGLLGYEHKS